MKLGQWLAGTGFVLFFGYLTAAEVAGHKTPDWPYVLFGAITVVGLGSLFLRHRNAQQKPGQVANDGRTLLQAMLLGWQTGLDELTDVKLQHVFYRGSDGELDHIFRDVPTNKLCYNEWSSGTGAPPAAGDPATMAWPDQQDVFYQQHVFYRGSDGELNHVFWDLSTNRLYYDRWCSGTGAPPAAGDPATMAWPDQQHVFFQQHVFYRGSDGRINNIYWDVRTNKLCYNEWSSGTGAPPAAGDPAIMAWPNEQHVFYRDSDGRINNIFRDVRTNKLYYNEWSSGTGAPPAAGDPATMTWPDQQHVFYRDSDGRINHIFRDVPTNRLYYDRWSSGTGAPPAAGDPATMLTC